MTRLFKSAAVLLCVFTTLAVAQTPSPGYVLLTGSHIYGTLLGQLLPSGQLQCQAVSTLNGQPISFHVGGSAGGQMVSRPFAWPIVNGVITADSSMIAPQLPDVSLTNPINIGFACQVIDPNTGVNILGPGYTLQSASTGQTSWCTTAGGVTTCSFDKFNPILGTQVALQTGPQGAPGAGFAAVQVEHVFSSAGTFNFNHNLAIQYPMMSCYVKSGSSAYAANPVDVNNMAISVVAPSDIVCAFGYGVQVATPVAPVVYANPINWTGTGGSSFTFSAAASGYPAPTVQWQTDTGTSGATWTNVGGATTTTYSAAASGKGGYRYEAVFMNSMGTATSAYATVTLAGDITTGLVAHWPMNEGSGSTFVDTVAANNFTASNVTWSSGKAVFNGSNASAAAGATPAPLASISTPLTVSFWLNTAALSGVQLCNTHMSGDNGYCFNINSNGSMGMTIVGSAGNITLTTPASMVVIGTRVNVLFTYDGSEHAAGAVFYINGVAQTPNVLTDTLSGSSAISISEPFILGAEPYYGTPTYSFYNGQIDSLRVYSRVLASQDIALIQTGSN